MSSGSDHERSALPPSDLAQQQILCAVRSARRRLLLNLGLERLVATLAAGALLGGGAGWLISWIVDWSASERVPLPLGAPLAGSTMLLVGATVGTVIGLAIGMVWCWRAAPSNFQAAMEIDVRLQSQERIASAWSVLQRGRPSEIGRALVVDAAHSLSVATMSHCFPILHGLRRLLLLPLSLLTLAILWWSLPTPSTTRSTSPSLTRVTSEESPPEASAEEQQRVRWAAELAAQRAEERGRALSEQGWRESAQLLSEVEQRLGELQQPERAERREALVTMNELRSALEERQQQLTASTAVRRVLDNLASFGPAEDAAAASSATDADADAGRAGSDGGSLERLRRLAEQLQPKAPEQSAKTTAPANDPPAEPAQESDSPPPMPDEAPDQTDDSSPDELGRRSDEGIARPNQESPAAGDVAGSEGEADGADDVEPGEADRAGEDPLMQQLLEELQRLRQATNEQAANEQAARGPPPASTEVDRNGLRELLESLQAAEDAARGGDEAEASQSLQQLLEQLSEAEREAGESEQLAGMLQDLERAKQEMLAASDDPNGMAAPSVEASGASGQRPGFGTEGASQPLLDTPPASTTGGGGEFYEAGGSTAEPTQPGLLAGRALGGGERGESRQRVTERVTRTEPLSDLDTGETGWLPRNQRQQTQQYFDALRGDPKP